MKCPRCQHENRPGAKFCEECGAQLALACAKCRSWIDSDTQALLDLRRAWWVMGTALFRALYHHDAARILERLDGQVVRIGGGANPWAR